MTETSGVRDGLGAIQDADESKREVLVSIPWEVLDTYNTDFARDCFDEFLGQRLPAMCWQHDKKEPIGVVKQWQKGRRANEFVAKFSDFEAVPRARQAFTQIRDGALTDFSFYFDQAKSMAHPSARGAIRFTRARMPELSPVTVGSIPGAVALGVRSEIQAVDEWYASVNGAFADKVAAGELTWDDVYALMSASDDATEEVTQECERALAELSLRFITGDRPYIPRELIRARLAATGPRSVGSLPDTKVSLTAQQQHDIDTGATYPKPETVPSGIRDERASLPPAYYREAMGDAFMDSQPITFTLPDVQPPPEIWAARPEGMSAEEAMERWNAARRR